MKRFIKKTLFLLAMAVAVAGCDSFSEMDNEEESQEKYYYAFNEKIFLDVVANKFVVGFDEQYLLKIQEYLQMKTQIRHIEFSEKYCILIVEESYVKTLREEFSKQTGIKSINPMYITTDSGVEMGVTDEIVVQFRENVSQKTINEMYKKYNLEIIEITELYQLLSVPINLDPLDVSNAIQTSGLANFSYPNFVTRLILFNSKIQ